MRARVLLVVLVGIALRLPALRVPILNEDEALYSVGAAAMQEGKPPYVAAVESKPPGIFYLYEGATGLVGRYRLEAVHALTIPWVLATGALLALIGGWRAALLYYVFVTVQAPSVLATQCELLFSLPLAGAAWLLLGGGPAVAAGFLIALATLIKPTAASLLGAALAWLVVRRDLRRLVGLAAGFAGGWLGAYLYFRSIGVWDDLVYWTFRWTTENYIPTGFSSFSWLARFGRKVAPWLGAWAALLYLAGRAARAWRVDARVQLLLLWAAAALAMLCLGGRFYDHYFPALVAPVAALAGLGAKRWGRLVVAGVALPALVCLGMALTFDRSIRLFDTRLPYDEVARYVKEHTAPSDKVFVWGYYPMIYVAADRLAATRFVGCHYLTGYAAIGLGARLPFEVEDRLALPGGFELLVRELEANRAAVIVDTAPANLHFWARYPLARYPILDEYVRTHYVREAVVADNVVYRRRD